MSIPECIRSIKCTVDKTYTYENLTHYPYYVDLSAKLVADTDFKASISKAGDIVVYDPTTDSLMPRIVKLDLNNNKLIIYWDGQTDMINNKEFYVLTSRSFNAENNSTAFNGYTHGWLFDEFVNGSTAYDSIGSADGVVTSATLASAGLVGNSGRFNQINSNVDTGISGEFSTPFTIEFLQNPTAYSVVMACGEGGVNDGWKIYQDGPYTIRIKINNTVIYNTNLITFGQWVYCAITVTSTGLKLYTNGSLRNQGSITLPNTYGNLIIGNNVTKNAVPNQYIDNVLISAGEKSSEYISTRNRLLRYNSTFYTLSDSVEGTQGLPIVLNPLIRKTYSIGENIKITGTGFISEQGAGSLKIGNLNQNVTSWGDTEIVAQVSCTSNGLQNILVTTKNGESNENVPQVFVQPKVNHWKSNYRPKILESKFNDSYLHLYVATDSHIMTPSSESTWHLDTFTNACRSNLPTAVIHCGDIADNDLMYTLRGFAMLKKTCRPYYLSIGNHDEVVSIVNDEAITNAAQIGSLAGYGYGPSFWSTTQLISGDGTCKARLLILDWNFYSDNRSDYLQIGDRCGHGDPNTPVGGFQQQFGADQIAWVQSVLQNDTDCDFIIYVSHDRPYDIGDLYAVLNADGRHVRGFHGHGHHEARTIVVNDKITEYYFLAQYETGAWTDFVIGFQNGNVVIEKAEIKNLIYPAALHTRHAPFTLEA